MFSEENVCALPVWTDLLLKKFVSIISFVCVCGVWGGGVVDGGHFPKSRPSCDLENGVKVIKF